MGYSRLELVHAKFSWISLQKYQNEKNIKVLDHWKGNEIIKLENVCYICQSSKWTNSWKIQSFKKIYTAILSGT